jgi:hypothetical protein
MGTKDPANVEIEFILPLAALSRRLSQVEAQLRLLNMKALEYSGARAAGPLARLTDAQLDDIDAALDGIRGVLSDLRKDTQHGDGKRGADHDD